MQKRVAGCIKPPLHVVSADSREMLVLLCLGRLLHEYCWLCLCVAGSQGYDELEKKGGLLILGKGKDAFVPAPPGEKRGIHSSEEGRGGVGRSVFPSP